MSNENPEWVCIGLGANLGEPAAQIRQAINRLSAIDHAEMRVSSLWRSRPVDCPPGSPDFVNAVVALQADSKWAPESLLIWLLALEAEFGKRDDSGTNRPRYLDLDLLLWGERQVRSPELLIPHPRALARAFVMLPLAELLPDLIWPGSVMSVKNAAAALQEQGLQELQVLQVTNISRCCRPWD